MIILKKSEPKSSDSSQQTEKTSGAPPKTTRKIHIGFGRKKQQNKEPTAPQRITQDPEETPQHTPSLSYNNIEKPSEKTDIFLEGLIDKDVKIENLPDNETGAEQPLSSKRKPFMLKDMKGKQVYLEDTGEVLGIVFDAVLDADKSILGYKIKDSQSEAILNFPLDQFDEDKNGLIFIPSWYHTGLKIIEKLEFKDRITPELIWLITDKTINVEELYNIFVKHDDKITHYIDEAVALRELITSRLKILEKERVSLKETLMDLTEKRLIKDIDRRQFSEDVMDHRRKVNILDINIKKCKDLLERLEHTSFGMLSKTMTTIDRNKKDTEQQLPVTFPSSEPGFEDHHNNDLYIEKYLELKQRYEKLVETHNDLKTAVEKLLIKNE